MKQTNWWLRIHLSIQLSHSCAQQHLLPSRIKIRLRIAHVSSGKIYIDSKRSKRAATFFFPLTKMTSECFICFRQHSKRIFFFFGSFCVQKRFDAIESIQDKRKLCVFWRQKNNSEIRLMNFPDTEPNKIIFVFLITNGFFFLSAFLCLYQTTSNTTAVNGIKVLSTKHIACTPPDINIIIKVFFFFRFFPPIPSDNLRHLTPWTYVIKLNFQ